MNDDIFKLSKLNLLAYCKLMNRNYIVADHIIRIANLLEEVERGETTHAIIVAPPRHGKSELVSRRFIPWFIGRNPTDEVMFATYNQGLANIFGNHVRNQLKDPYFCKIFNGVHLSQSSKSKSEFSTNLGGQYHAAGVGGGFAGKGARLLVMDDTIKNKKESMSPTFRRNLHDAWDTDLSTRLTPDGRVIAMHTRWHEEDMIGYLLSEWKHLPWKVLHLKAIQDDGTALFPERYPIEWLKRQQEGMNKRGNDFEALYQGHPVQKEGQMVKRSWFKHYITIPSDAVYYSTWDLAQEGKDTSDYVVGITVAFSKGKIYIVDIYREQVSFLEQCAAILNTNERWSKILKIIVENKSNGPAAIDGLKKRLWKIQPFEPNKWGSKTDRLDACSIYLSNENVLLPASMPPWAKAFLDEICFFPYAKNDDQVDALTQLIIYLIIAKQSKGSTSDILGDYAH